MRGIEMDGIQLTVYEGLRFLANRVKDGHYGKDDHAFEDDSRAVFIEDVNDEVLDKME